MTIKPYYQDESEEKGCTKCKQRKPLTEFLRNKRTKYGYNSWCKQCMSENRKRWNKANPERVREYGKAWYQKNRERVYETSKQWAIANREKARKYSKRWSKANPQKVRELSYRRYNTVKGRLNSNIGRAMRKSLHSNKDGRAWEQLAGYSLKKLKKHLEKQFQPGMTWNNYGIHGWHIDHKVPISAFNFKKPEDIDFKHCWALNNLRPMWAKENIAKHNNLDKAFQPSFIF